ncbi:MAG: PAS domain S-box protein, partial [Acetobacteraceae bacterium]|nr:PAS domain S-box protein [Acetobacteraceae bacterium]
MAWLSAGSAAEATAREELRTILEELQATALELAERNAVLAALNQRLEGEVAMRAAELEAALAALREEEDRLRLIVEGARDIAILTFDTEGRVSTWNPGAERLLGFTADEVLGRRLDAIWVPEDLAADAPAAEMSRTLEQGRAEDERWHLCK